MLVRLVMGEQQVFFTILLGINFLNGFLLTYEDCDDVRTSSVGIGGQ